MADEIARLGALRGATIVCDDLGRVVEAYGRALGYGGAVDSVSAGDATRWGTPAARGLPSATLFPQAGGTRFLRFVECNGAEPPAPHRTIGWNAIELVVQDLDRLADRLSEAADFRIIGPPATLEFDFTDRIRAMQVVGPAGELLYFTSVGGDVPGFDLPVARCFVDAPFVAILGTRDLETSMAWYGRATGAAVASFDAPVGVISAAHSLDMSLRHRLATAALPDASLIEIDELPRETTEERTLADCGLPSGIAVIALQAGQRAGLTGSHGERIELLDGNV